MSEENVDKYLPLTEATYYILTALDEPLHGYAVMQRVEQTSAGTVKLGPGTLYGAFSTLEKENLIQMVAEDERRKSYMLTEKGRRLLRRQVERLEIMLRNGQRFILANKV
jgi:DNA-binding PadR family transcriptional regulator